MKPSLLTTALLVGTLGCGEPKAPWWTQVEASGPCHEVNLRDGLDTESGTELQNTLICLNQGGNLDPLVPLIEALESPTRDAETAGKHLALGIDALLQADLNVFDLLPFLLRSLDSEAGLVDEFLRVLVELIYAAPYPQLEGREAPASQNALDSGALLPLMAGLRQGLIVSLDEDLAPLEVAEEVLDSNLSLDALHTLSLLTESKNEGFRLRIEDLLQDFGSAIVRSQSPSNDRWPGASGDSIRDLGQALILNRSSGGKTGFQLAQEAASDLFGDAAAQQRVLDALEGLFARDALRSMPLQLGYLASVDSTGGGLQTGEDSAFVSMFRLMSNANAPLKCEINWGLGSYSVELGNLSVEILNAISELDPNVATESVDLLGRTMGWPLTEGLLRAVAESGVCPILDAQFVSDLSSIDRLNDVPSGDLLLVLVEVLKALGEGSNSRIPEMVDLASIPHAIRATEAIEESLRDLGGSPFLESLAAFAGPVLHPGDHLSEADLPEGRTVFAFEALWHVVALAFEKRSNGLTALEQIEPLWVAVMKEESTWRGIRGLGELLSDKSSHTSGLLLLVPALLDEDPELKLVRQFAGVFLDRELANHFAQVLEIEELFEAVSRSTVETPGAMPFVAELQLSGTMRSLLGTLNRTIGLLISEP